MELGHLDQDNVYSESLYLYINYDGGIKTTTTTTTCY